MAHLLKSLASVTKMNQLYRLQTQEDLLTSKGKTEELASLLNQKKKKRNNCQKLFECCK